MGHTAKVRRIKEYVTVRLAMDRLDQHTRDDPTVLQYDLRFRHIGAASTQGGGGEGGEGG